MGVNQVYYGNQKLIDLTEDTATAADVLSGKTLHLKNGNSAVGTIPNNGSVSGNISTKAELFSVPAGYTSGGSIGISSTEQAKIIAGNIKSGVTLLGQQGSFSSDANAAAEDILLSKTAYVNGSKVTGTMPDYSAYKYLIKTSKEFTIVPDGDQTKLYIPICSELEGRPIRLLQLYAGMDYTITSTATQRHYVSALMYTRGNLYASSDKHYTLITIRLQRTTSNARIRNIIWGSSTYVQLKNEDQLSTGGAYIDLLGYSASELFYFRNAATYYLMIGG